MVLDEAVVRTGIRVVRFGEGGTPFFSRCQRRHPGRPSSGRSTGTSKLGGKRVIRGFYSSGSRN